MLSITFVACATTDALVLSAQETNLKILAVDESKEDYRPDAPSYLMKFEKAIGKPWQEADYAEGITVLGNNMPVPFEKGAISVLNRPDRTWEHIPEELAGMTAYTYSIAVQRPVIVNVEHAGLVYFMVAQHAHSNKFASTLVRAGAVPTTFKFRLNGTRDMYFLWQINVENRWVVPPTRHEHGVIVLVPNAQLSAAESNETIELLPSNFKHPIRSGWLSSRFGYRNDPITGNVVFHDGVDLATRASEKAYAAAAGIVIFSGEQEHHGNRVEIWHSAEYTTSYSHLGSIDVAVGDKVNQCDVLGQIGPTTGRSTGPHLGYEVIKNGRKVDPINYLFGTRGHCPI